MSNEKPAEKQLDDLKPKDQTPIEAEQVKGGAAPIDGLKLTSSKFLPSS